MIQRECDNDLLVKLSAFWGVCVNNYHFPGDSSFLVRPQIAMNTSKEGGGGGEGERKQPVIWFIGGSIGSSN